MKKKLIYTLVVFIMFISPFLILSNHFLNIVDMVSYNNVVLNMEVSINSISSKITTVLIDKYDVLRELRAIKGDDKNIINKIKEIVKNRLVKKISYYSKDGVLYFSTDLNEKKKISDNYIFDNAKKLDVPVGVISYPQDAPPELIMAEKIGNSIFISVTDLGHLNEMLFKFSKKTIGKIYLIDGSCNIIFDSNYDYVFNNGAVIDKDIIKLIDDLKSKNIFNYKGTILINGKKTIIALSNIDTTNWWVFNVMDYSHSIDIGLKKWARRVIISGIILIFAFSYITLLIYQKFYYEEK